MTAEGGSYVKQPDGTEVLVEGTKPAPAMEMVVDETGLMKLVPVADAAPPARKASKP